MRLTVKLLTLATFCFLLFGTIGAQTKKNSRETPTPDPTPEAKSPTKRNERPEAPKDPKVLALEALKNQPPATHFYEFTRPGFSYGKVVIEHNDQGKGSISFLKDGFDEMITDPIELSAKTLASIKSTLTELTFLDSTDEYQFVGRDYTHMGNMTFTLNKDGRSRTVKYNWTENKAAKALMDEYRRISNEYTWKFEIILARQNMPLQTPGLMDALDSYFRRSEISDPPHMLPFLTELSNDERIPLMARNKAGKLAKEIEKQKP